MDLTPDVRTGCFVCGRATYDPDKREGYWTRGVRGGHLVLICPSCQLSREWRSQLDRCEQCGIARWHRRPLSLCLHHVNGERHDNRLENLVLLCPNCHSQTPNFGSKNWRRRPE